MYVRGFLRSYSSYLGLDADKVLGVFNRSHGGPADGPASPAPRPTGALTHPNGHPLIHRTGRWGIAVAVAVVVLIAVAAIALLGGSGEPEATGALATTPTGPALESGASVVANLRALQEVQATITVDGRVEFEGLLERGEARSLVGQESIELALAEGGVVDLQVNEVEIGTPGEPGEPYTVVFRPQDYRNTPSPPGG